MVVSKKARVKLFSLVVLSNIVCALSDSSGGIPKDTSFPNDNFTITNVRGRNVNRHSLENMQMKRYQRQRLADIVNERQCNKSPCRPANMHNKMGYGFYTTADAEKDLEKNIAEGKGTLAKDQQRNASLNRPKQMYKNYELDASPTRTDRMHIKMKGGFHTDTERDLRGLRSGKKRESVKDRQWNISPSRKNQMYNKVWHGFHTHHVRDLRENDAIRNAGHETKTQDFEDHMITRRNEISNVAENPFRGGAYNNGFGGQENEKSGNVYEGGKDQSLGQINDQRYSQHLFNGGNYNEEGYGNSGKNYGQGYGDLGFGQASGYGSTTNAGGSIGGRGIGGGGIFQGQGNGEVYKEYGNINNGENHNGYVSGNMNGYGSGAGYKTGQQSRPVQNRGGASYGGAAGHNGGYNGAENEQEYNSNLYGEDTSYNQPTPHYQDEPTGLYSPTPGYVQPTPKYEKPTQQYYGTTNSYEPPPTQNQPPITGYYEPTPKHYPTNQPYEAPTHTYYNPTPTYIPNISHYKYPTATPIKIITASPSNAGVIGGFAWEDTNANGIKEFDEPGRVGVTVNLFGTDDALVDSTTTNGDGLFEFDGIVPGNYYFEFVQPAGFMFSPKDIGPDDSIDSDTDVTGRTDTFTVIAGVDDLSLGAGLVAITNTPTKIPTKSPSKAPTTTPTMLPSASPSASPSNAGVIGGFAWEDTNANGIKEFDEPGRVGVTVNLFGTDDALVDSTTTNGDGLFEFDGIVPGNYYFEFVQPAGFMFSPKDIGLDDSIDSDTDVTGRTDTFTVIAGVDDLSLGAGLVAITNTPSASPTECVCQNRRAEIFSVLSGVSEPTLLNNPSAPQGQAFEWIVNSDPLELCPKCVVGCQFIQRYVMALFYFSTEGDNWGNCAALGSCVNLPSLMPCNGVTPGNWLSGENECDWCGNTCNSDVCLTKIQIESQNMSGTLPNEMSELTNLLDIRLEKGAIGGTIPTTIGELTELEFLDLDFQNLVGSLPSSLWSLTNLSTLDLNNNSLTGTISTSIGNFLDLDFLQISQNDFSGTIPDVFSQLTLLRRAFFEENNFTGSMPVSMCGLRPNIAPIADDALEFLRADCTDAIECPDVNGANCCTRCF